MECRSTLQGIHDGPAIFADFPEFVEPLQFERRFLAPPVMNAAGTGG